MQILFQLPSLGGRELNSLSSSQFSFHLMASIFYLIKNARGKLFRQIMQVVFLLATFTFASQLRAQEVDPCSALTLPATITSEGDLDTPGAAAFSGCFVTPQVYEVILYEIGLCTANADPYNRAKMDFSGCQRVFNSDSGFEANLVNTDGSPRSVDLSKMSLVRPPNGDYKFAYVVIGNKFSIQTELVLTSETWNSQPLYNYVNDDRSGGWQISVGRKTGSPSSSKLHVSTLSATDCYLETVVKGNTVRIASLLGRDGSVSSPVAGTERLPDGTLGTAGGTTYCSNTRFLAGVQTLSVPLVIDDSISSLLVEFDTTNIGARLVVYEYTDVRVTTDVGPLSIRITAQ